MSMETHRADDADADVYGDSDFLAQRDKTVRDFRESDKDTKRKIIGKMLTLRHNMKYNKHLLSVYMKAKGLFDTMIEEHRAQLHYLDEIYRHLNHLIRENLSSKQKNTGANAMMNELVKDKKRIGALLKKMRGSFNKLMDIDTVIGVTIAQINEITFMEDHDDECDSEDEGDSEGEADDSEDEDDDSEYEDEDDDSEDEADDDEADDDEPDDDEADDDEPDTDTDTDTDEDDSEGEAEAEPDEPDTDTDSDTEAQNSGSIYLF